MGSRGFSKRNICLVCIFAITIYTIILVALFSSHAPTLQYSLHLSSQHQPIPNIVHYIYLKKNADSALSFKFQDFLSLYAALIYFNPTTIFIHTDHNASYIKEAATTGNIWTRLILSTFTNVRTNFVQASTHAGANNITIENIEHKSDFVRMQQLYLTGGIYLDWDVLPLRDVKPLREAGFRFIVGRQAGGELNNGAVMATKGSKLAYLMTRDAPAAFDGKWVSHSVHLITPLAERLVAVPGEVLIVDQKAFSPTNWNDESVAQLYGPHPNAPVSSIAQSEDEERDPVARWDNRRKVQDWVMDFSATYLLHAYHRHEFPGFGGATVEYVLRRDSNYALAAWPVVMRAIDGGILDLEELGLYDY